MHQTYKSGWQMFVVILCGLLTVQPVTGQPVAAQVGLRIVVIEGAGTNNVIQQIPATSLVVRIENANGPVPGAMVVFTAPEAGPSGEFANDSSVFGVITGMDGLAAADGYHPNAVTGSYQIAVRAEFRGEVATTTIQQRNSGSGGGAGKVIAILAIVGAAAGAGVAYALRSDNSSVDATPNFPVISIGGGAVGAPAQ